jgi:KamA family protein
MKKVKYIDRIEKIKQLSEQEKWQLRAVTDKYRFRANDYYLSLIDWDDPQDPIRNLIIPHLHELEEWGHLDPSGEKNFTILPGLEHKYPSTVLLLVSNVCGGICRYCFRKRVFISTHGEVLQDLPAAVEYIREHKEITNVLMTGGDPLVLSTNKLKRIVEAVMEIEHVRIIRLGTRMPAFDPYRVLDDPELEQMIQECQRQGKQIYVMTHFNHPRELTAEARQAVKILHHAGAVLTNQTPLIRGCNADPLVLAELFRELSFAGVPPYYVFQCRPASGNKEYAIPIEEGYQIFEKAKSMVSGLAKRARFVMSHVSGKIEIVGLTAENVYMKYHRAAEEVDSGDFIIFPRNPEAYWFDDYLAKVEWKNVDWYYDAYGPE